MLTEQEIDDLSREMVKGCKSVNWLAKKIESAVLERLKAQGDVGVVVDNGTRGTTTIRRNDDIGMIAYGTRLYEHPLPPDDVVRDAERYRWLVDNSYDRDGFLQFQVWKHSWEPHSQTGIPIEWKCRVRGPAIDAAIDAAMKGGAA